MRCTGALGPRRGTLLSHRVTCSHREAIAANLLFSHFHFSKLVIEASLLDKYRAMAHTAAPSLLLKTLPQLLGLSSDSTAYFDSSRVELSCVLCPRR